MARPEWISETFPAIAVFSIGYASGAASFQSEPGLQVGERARTILDLLSNNGLLDETPLIFIAPMPPPPCRPRNMCRPIVCPAAMTPGWPSVRVSVNDADGSVSVRGGVADSANCTSPARVASRSVPWVTAPVYADPRTRTATRSPERHPVRTSTRARRHRPGVPAGDVASGSAVNTAATSTVRQLPSDSCVHRLLTG